MRCAVLLFALVACAPSRAVVPFGAQLGHPEVGARLVVVGDTQRTGLVEVWRERNEPERRRVLGAIAQAEPNLVAFTGDLVFDGGSDEHWAEFDAFAAALRERHVPVITAFGNHEYWEGRAAAERHVFPRFPLVGARHWYAVPFGPVRLVVLDSNEGELSPVERDAEHAWYGETLAACDADPSVRGVLVLLHHPAWTNSTVTGDEPTVERDVVPPFLAAKKTLALLSGHVHSYERFVRDGKTFVVSGGGGGPRARLDVGPGRRHPDDQFCGPALRDFHFTVYTLGARGLDAEVRGLAKGATTFHTMDRFTLPFP